MAMVGEEQNTQTVGTSGRIAAILDTVRFKSMEYVQQLLTDQKLCRREIGDQEQKDNWNWRSVRRPAKSSADVTSEVSMRGVSEAYRAEGRKNKDIKVVIQSR